ncbi:peroxisomal membrane protein 4-like protein [Thamnocephalis sphaerospora]|uniref:Peroxisomal membrane protein 4-like protein n=1 Tax=Thamnocephalis sphaerospora TaxID=78915 RepID=A0A4P9XQV9_9FUNG|nr:peroxisomal membrane protein 4-like protein [Thamnocephalis sphaerospora]|eukprot:RKP08428.1 peroxisomal membrane protein 4-like protein [Thamnocephalis sphaerospora]
MSLDAVNAFINNPAYHDVLSIVKGFRNGLVYGTKIRFPHALVMTFLFRDGSIKEKMEIVLKATKTHARNLAFFVTIYKTLMLVQRKLCDGKELSAHSFLAGLVGGYFVFGKNTSVNKQIVLYVFARVVLAVAKLPARKGLLPREPPQAYPIFAALSWGAIMWLFRYERPTVHSSLQASMQYLYNDSDHWQTLRNFVWHNK